MFQKLDNKFDTRHSVTRFIVDIVSYKWVIIIIYDYILRES